MNCIRLLIGTFVHFTRIKEYCRMRIRPIATKGVCLVPNKRTNNINYFTHTLMCSNCERKNRYKSIKSIVLMIAFNDLRCLRPLRHTFRILTTMPIYNMPPMIDAASNDGQYTMINIQPPPSQSHGYIPGCFLCDVFLYNDAIALR